MGASDGGSSTGLLLELARVLEGEPRTDDVYLVFLDGEEAIANSGKATTIFTAAAIWPRNGARMARCEDQSADQRRHDRRQASGYSKETNGNAALNGLVWTTASELGYEAYFWKTLSEDDDTYLL